NSELAEHDIARRQEQTFVGSVPYDRIDRQSRLNALYEWDALKDFIAYVLGKDTFHRFADPFGACSINVFVDGGEHGWHFDESEFTVTLMLQPPEKGGTFEYLPLIRGLENEKELVAGVLDGKRDGVVELPFTAGTLLIFGGRQTIHRVTRVEGERPRLVPVLCYSETPNLQNSETVRQLFWGRRGPDDEPTNNGSVVAA
ncbi:MAG: HalD/BesD family halogenase, partial [Thiolinea sp.]